MRGDVRLRPLSLISLFFSPLFSFPRTIEEGQRVDDTLKSSSLIKLGLEHDVLVCFLQMRIFRNKRAPIESNSC